MSYILVIIVAVIASAAFTHLHAQAGLDFGNPFVEKGADPHVWQNNTLSETHLAGNLHLDKSQADMNSNLEIQLFDKDKQIINCDIKKYVKCGFNLSGIYYADDYQGANGDHPVKKDFSTGKEGKLVITTSELNSLWSGSTAEEKDGKVIFKIDNGYFSWINTKELTHTKVHFKDVKVDSGVMWIND